MNIYKIEVKNYKSIRNSGEIEIDDKIMAFIGQNNAGKSAILDAIQCVFPSTKKTVNRSDFHKGTRNNIEICIWFNGVTDEYLQEKFILNNITKLDDKLSKLKEEYQIDDNNMCVKLVVTNGDRIGTKYYVGTESEKEIKNSKSYSCYQGSKKWKYCGNKFVFERINCYVGW